MRVFKDNSGTEWKIDLSVSTLRRVKELLTVDLTLPQLPVEGHGTLSQQLVSDVWLLVDVLCAVCRPQAETAGITDEQFAERLGGAAIGEARSLLFEEWSDFFRSLGRLDLATAVAKTWAMSSAIGDEAVTQMNELGNQILDEAKTAMKAAGTIALKSAMAKIHSESGG